MRRKQRRWTSRPVCSCSHEFLFRCRLKFRASVRRPDSCSRRKTVRHSKSAFRRDIPEHVSSGACGTPVGYSSHSCTWFPGLRGLSTVLFPWVNVRSTSHSGLCLSKYPSENARQVSVFDIRIPRDYLAQSVHFILIRVGSFAVPQLKI